MNSSCPPPPPPPHPSNETTMTAVPKMECLALLKAALPIVIGSDSSLQQQRQPSLVLVQEEAHRCIATTLQDVFLRSTLHQTVWSSPPPPLPPLTNTTACVSFRSVPNCMRVVVYWKQQQPFPTTTSPFDPSDTTLLSTRDSTTNDSTADAAAGWSCLWFKVHMLFPDNQQDSTTSTTTPTEHVVHVPSLATLRLLPLLPHVEATLGRNDSPFLALATESTLPPGPGLVLLGVNDATIATLRQTILDRSSTDQNPNATTATTTVTWKTVPYLR
jgi:hypothetical protein